MLAKITKGRDFYGCLRYVMEREKADRIGSNMEGVTLQELVAEFNLSVQRQQRHSPRNLAEVLVCHTSLSVEVGRDLDVQTWNAIAKDYLNAMGFDDNQFVMIRHTDTQHAHVHLVIARSRLDGTMVSGWFDYRKAQLVLRKLEQDYQLQSVRSSWETEIKAPTVNEIRRFRETGEPSVRVMLQVAIDDVLSTSTDLNEFRQRLADYGVEVRLRQISTGIAGISYKLNEIAFPGFKLGKRYTWSRIQTQLGENYERCNETSCQVQAGTTEFCLTNPTTPDLDQQFGTPSATRTEAETCSSIGGSGEEFDSRESVTASIRESPVADSDSNRESISAVNQHQATDRNKYTANEFDPRRASGEFADIPTGPSRPQKRDRSSPNNKRDIQPKPFRHQDSESTSDRAGAISEPTAAETDRPSDRVSQPTSPTSPNQTRMGENLRSSDAIRDFDRLHSGTDAEISAASKQSIPSNDAERSTQVILRWQDYSDRIDEPNPVKRDEKVARLAISEQASKEITRRKRKAIPSRELSQTVTQLLQQSPYVQWMREIQGDEKTDNYVKLTIQAASQPEKVSQKQKSQHRQQQKSRQRSLGR